MHVETVIAGFGGQGILFLGRVLATAGMIGGYHVSWYPSYGPEMRGGTANCTVILSDQEIGSTISDHPDIVVVTNQPALLRFGPLVKEEGLLVINSSLVRGTGHCPTVEVLNVPGNEIAGAMVGDPRTLNMVILGALVAHRPLVWEEDMRLALEEILSGKKRELIEINFQALDAGKKFIRERRDAGVSERPNE
ncbi:MAG: 2-oxoacid:acceptor oxidoreductase family protein [Atribacterota bacterium]|nr:2-oxoacid:acceptor oxidoreductase family protein [Candidatus Atribacteria bacterium]